KFFTMMNNIRQNNMPVFDTSDADPRNWKKFTFVKDPSWVGDYPSPFHLCFSMDRSKMFVSVLSLNPSKTWVAGRDTMTRPTQDLLKHQKSLESPIQTANHRHHIRRQVRTTDILGLPAAGIGRLRLHPGH